MSSPFSWPKTQVEALFATRTCLGFFLLYHNLSSFSEWIKQGFFASHFHLSFLHEYLLPNVQVYVFLLVVRLIFSVMVILGYRARWALFGSAILILYSLLCDRLHFHHNRYALSLYSFLFSLSACDRNDFFKPIHPSQGLYGVKLALLQLSLIYLASGGSKALDPDWQKGLVLADRLKRYGYDGLIPYGPKSLHLFFSDLILFLQSTPISIFLSHSAIAIELFLAIALWISFLRPYALFVGLLFHGLIQITARVEIFSLLTLNMYLCFLDEKQWFRLKQCLPGHIKEFCYLVFCETKPPARPQRAK